MFLEEPKLLLAAAPPWLPSPLNTQPALAESLAVCFSVFLENGPVLPGALLNKPVDCVLLGVSGAWWFITSLGWPIPRRTSCTLVFLCWVQSLRSRKELEYSRTLRALYTIAVNLVAIDRYQCVRVLQARLVSVISTDDARRPLLFAPRSFAWLICFAAIFSCCIVFKWHFC